MSFWRRNFSTSLSKYTISILTVATKGDPRGGQDDKRAVHKHQIRRCFHKQLRNLWHFHPAISRKQGGYDVFKIPRPEGYPERLGDEPLLRENLAKFHEINGHNFVPLVCEQFYVLCGLKVLMLRRDAPGRGGIFNLRDLDNRLKTLFDALKMPKNLGEMAGCDFSDDEQPMYVLLQDDKLVSHVSIETDDLLDETVGPGDDSIVRLLVTVDVKPWQTTMFNLSFAGE